MTQISFYTFKKKKKKKKINADKLDFELKKLQFGNLSGFVVGVAIGLAVLITG